MRPGSREAPRPHDYLKRAHKTHADWADLSMKGKGGGLALLDCARGRWSSG